MKFQFLPENFSRSENAPPFETRKIRQFEVERIFLKNKKMLDVRGGGTADRARRSSRNRVLADCATRATSAHIIISFVALLSGE